MDEDGLEYKSQHGDRHWGRAEYLRQRKALTHLQHVYLVERPDLLRHPHGAAVYAEIKAALARYQREADQD